MRECRMLYADRANRDAMWRKLKGMGYPATRSSVRNQLIHPMYVEDRKGGLTAEDCGFGNTIYKTHFAVLYEVSWPVDRAA